MSVTRGFIVPGKPQPLLSPDACTAWSKIRAAFDRVRKEIERSDADLILLYSTQWFSILGHQIQADPEPKWTLVDQEFHELGEMPYEFRMDAEFGKLYAEKARARGLHARSIAYHGFPIDTGTVVALKLLNPSNRLPASVVSCNMYADRAETLVLGKAAGDALRESGKKAIAIGVTALSNRMHTDIVLPEDDHISAGKDDEWNRKILEILGEGRLEDVAQHAREFAAEANGDQKLKAIWWLSALMGQHNQYQGEVYEYQPLYGTGAALVSLTPSASVAQDLEFDEEDVDVYSGDRNVLDAGVSSGDILTAPDATAGVVHVEAAPRPVGAFPHARRAGNLLFLSGMGPRTPGSDEIPGGPVRSANGKRLEYDIEAQTRAVIENVKTVLVASGSSLDEVIDIQCFLIDMDRDFERFNRVYAEYFSKIQATRTTVAIDALPTPIAVEFKVVASVG
jgi:2-aminophenol/2-amino-5-chlorophenol 1,6-dioxygenase alpha subunit